MQDRKFQAFLDVLHLLEKHDIQRSKAPLMGSYALNFQAGLSEGDEPEDIDILAADETVFYHIFDVLKLNNMINERSRFETVMGLDENHPSNSPDLFGFRYNNQCVEIFNGSTMNGVLSGNVGVVKELDVCGNTIYVRPKELIKEDYRKAVRNINDDFHLGQVIKYECRLKYL